MIELEIMKPTRVRIKKFWKGYGWTYTPRSPWYSPEYWNSPLGETIDHMPLIDLNNLFQYAVPKLYELGYWMQWFLDSNGCDVRVHHLNTQDNYSIYQHEDPALALFWALDKVRREK